MTARASASSSLSIENAEATALSIRNGFSRSFIALFVVDPIQRLPSSLLMQSIKYGLNSLLLPGPLAQIVAEYAGATMV
jgi:hypothetical protein